MNASVSVPPIFSSVSTTSGMPSPFWSPVTTVSTLSMAKVPSTATKPITSIAAAPLARVTCAASTKDISTVDTPVSTVTPASVWPVWLIPTLRSVSSIASPSTPSNDSDLSVPLAAIAFGACTVRLWLTVEKMTSPSSPSVARTPISSAVP